MKKLTLAIVLLLAANISFSQVEFKNGSVSEILAMAKSQNKVIMVDVLTEWCKWCIELDNKVYSKPEVGEFANANQINYKIDAEVGEGIDFAKKYGVSGYPTILFLDASGNEIDRIVGYVPAKDFKEMMMDYNKGVNTYNDLKAKLEKNPADVEANLKFADKLMATGKDDDAKACLNKIVEVDAANTQGKTDDAKYRLATLSGKDNAITELEKFISDNPSSDILNEAYVSLSEQYAYGKKDFPSAEKWFKEALSKFPDNDYVKSSYGQFANYQGSTLADKKDATEEDYKQGLSYIETAIPYVAGSVNEGSSYYIQSKLYFNLKDYSKAMESVEKALKIFNRKLYREHKEKIEKQLSSK
jgi:tetratricopeptide (TPR) repeat protein